MAWSDNKDNVPDIETSGHTGPASRDQTDWGIIKVPAGVVFIHQMTSSVSCDDRNMTGHLIRLKWDIWVFMGIPGLDLCVKPPSQWKHLTVRVAREH